MAQRTVISVADWGGLDETFADEDCPPNRLRQATNVSKNNVGQLGKRYGFSALTTVANASRLGSYGAELLAVDGTNLKAYSNSWRTRGRVPGCIATLTPFEAGASGSGTQADIITGGGMTAVAWDTANQGTYAAVMDSTTGSIIAPLQQMNGIAYKPRLVYFNSTLVLLYRTGTGITSRAFNAGTGLWGNENLIVASPNVTLDASPVSILSNSAAIVYGTTGNEVYVLTINSAGTILAGPTLVTTGLPAQANVAVRSSVVSGCWVAWSSNNGGTLVTTTSYAVHNYSTLVQTLAPTTLGTASSNYPAFVGIESMSSASSLVTWSLGDVGFRWAVATPTGTVQATTIPRKDWVVTSRPFKKTTNGVTSYFVQLLYQQTYQTTGVLAELDVDTSRMFAGTESFYPMATVNPRSSVFISPSTTSTPGDLYLGRVFGVDSVGDASRSSYQTLAFALSSQGTSSLEVVKYEWAHTGLYQSVEAGDSTYFAGGVPFSYDGKRTYENSMLHAPKFTATSATTGGVLQQGGSPEAISYRYIAVFEQDNARGETSYSPPNDYAPVIVTPSPVGAVGPSTGKATLTIQTLRSTYRSTSTTDTPVTIAIYRTIWSGGGPSPVYYRIGTVVNDPTVSTVTFVDDAALGMADTGIGGAPAASQRVLYTTGNVLESGAPPSLYFLAYHNERLFGLGPDQRTIWYTTPVVDGEQPRWNDALKIVVHGLGDLTALASLDGKLIVFSATGMATIFGDGPSDTGAGADFSLPQILPFGVGCTDARSLCVMPQGVTFLSQKGLYLYTRAGEVQPIGLRIQRSTAGLPYVTSAVHVERDAQVLFTFNSTLTSSGVGLVVCWDYRYDAWTIWQPYAANSGGSFPRLVSAKSVQGTYYALSSTTGGTDIIYQDRTTYLDSGRFVFAYVQTPWIKSGELGWQRINRLQVNWARGSACGMAIECTRDYSLAAGDTTTFTEAQVLAASPAQFDIIPKTQKCEAFSLLLSDNAPAVLGTGQGFTLGSVTFQVVLKGSEFKGLPANQKG